MDYDNEPDLPDNHIPFTKGEMKTLPSMAIVFDLISAAIRQMSAILAQMDSVPQDEQNRYTVFGYHTDHKFPFASWVAACTADEAKTVIGQQQPAVVVCGIVKGWTRLDSSSC